jgi:electron transport complex protein RnfG
MKKAVLIPVLTIVLCAVLLMGVAAVTSGMYMDNSLSWHMQDMQTVLPGAEGFSVEPYAGEDANIVSVHKADVGYVIETRTYGYAGNITVLVGVSNEGKVTGLVVRDLSETVGLGANALHDTDFLAQFPNKTGSFAIGTPGADAFSGATATETTGEEIYVDGITGATVTSKAIARCVNSAVGYVTGADVESGATSWGG